MEDTISRKMAIDVVSYSIELCNKALDSITLGGRDRYAVEVERNSLLKLKDDIKLLPSAQPEMPEWAQKVEEYRKSAPSFVRNQLVWALYQTWKEYDGRLVHQRGKENR